METIIWTVAFIAFVVASIAIIVLENAKDRKREEMLREYKSSLRVNMFH